MRITEITYSKGQTLQLRQYEPTNIHYSAKAEVGEDDDLHMAYAELREYVDKEVEIQSALLLSDPQKLARQMAKKMLKDADPF